MLSRQYLVRGVVQGVGFRFFVQSAARHLDLRGFVRNLPDGSVEVRAEGDEEALADFRSKLQRGPAGARVEEVVEQDLPPASFPFFAIRQ